MNPENVTTTERSYLLAVVEAILFQVFFTYGNREQIELTQTTDEESSYVRKRAVTSGVWPFPVPTDWIVPQLPGWLCLEQQQRSNNGVLMVEEVELTIWPGQAEFENNKLNQDGAFRHDALFFMGTARSSPQRVESLAIPQVRIATLFGASMGTARGLFDMFSPHALFVNSLHGTALALANSREFVNRTYLEQRSPFL